jgi:hypothetical protein
MADSAATGCEGGSANGQRDNKCCEEIALHDSLLSIHLQRNAALRQGEM